MIVNGWSMRLALVNLRSREVVVETFDHRMLREKVGGRALNVAALSERTREGLDPFNPDSPFCMAVGPLTGSQAPCAASLHLASRSPLSDPATIALSSVMGSAGPRMKWAGFDQIILTGRAETPVFLAVQDGAITFHDAASLWGTDTVSATVGVQQALGDRSASVLAIGLAGENEVRFASILADCAWFADGLGLGAVLGSKRCKAIAFLGTDTLRSCHGSLLREKARDLRSAFDRSQGIQQLKRAGTLFPFEDLQKQNAVTERNFTSPPPHRAPRLTLRAYDKAHFSGRVGCLSCPIHCGRYTAGEELSSRGIHFGGLHFEGAAALSWRMGMHRWLDVLKVYHACVLQGIDPRSFGSLAAWLTDGNSRGLLQTSRAGRLLAWNEAQPLLSLVETVARREGPGRYLGEGAYREARRAGGGAERILPHVMGVDWPGLDPRIHMGTGLSFATGSYLWGPMQSLDCPLPQDLHEDRQSSWKEAPRRLADARMLACLADMAGVCSLAAVQAGGLTVRDIAEMLYAVTGEDYTEGELVRAAARDLEAEGAVLVRDGVSLDALRPSERFFVESVPRGPFEGAVLRSGDFLAARSGYYEAVRQKTLECESEEAGQDPALESEGGGPA